MDLDRFFELLTTSDLLFLTYCVYFCAKGTPFNIEKKGRMGVGEERAHNPYWYNGFNLGETASMNQTYRQRLYQLTRCPLEQQLIQAVENFFGDYQGSLPSDARTCFLSNRCVLAAGTKHHQTGPLRPLQCRGNHSVSTPMASLSAIHIRHTRFDTAASVPGHTATPSNCSSNRPAPKNPAGGCG